MRCLIAIHDWKVHKEPDVEPYFECARCGKMQEWRLGPLHDGGLQ